MTESNQLQATENNNQGVVKMEPPPVSPSPSEQQYALKWNDFQASILSSFRHLRDEEDFVDVTLACDQRSFTAHKVVLSACSPYFRKLLKANPCEHPIVILRDVRAEDVESLLRFMYNGEVNIGHEQLSDFLKTAQLLQVRGLVDVTGNNVPKASNFSTSTATATSTAPTFNNTINTSTTPAAVQELKASPTSTSLPWELSDDRSNHLTPPPQKRIKSADLYRAQHGISPERLLIDRELPIGQHPLTRERDRNRDRDHSRDTSRDRDRSLELRDSLLGQALESGQQLPTSQKHPDLASLQAQSTGEDSNSSDSEPSDRGDGQLDVTMDSMNGSMDNQRTHSFPSAFLGLQGIPGLLPGPSGIHGADNFVTRRSLEMRVRATDPRPCPKCGKIYRSAHTLRTHLEDKHTVCPGYRCVLCGTVAKSRNSLHSHMSRQHRGISTKDLPVLPMPSPFDPDLASKLLAKAGVKISPAELRARASPTTGTRRGDSKVDLRGGDDDDDMDDPEDLTTGGNNNNNNSSSRYHDGILGYGHPNTTITRIRSETMTPKNMDSIAKDHGTPLPPTSSAGQSLLDTYLQFITENTFGMQMSQEHAAAALHAAKMAQLNAMGHNLDKLPPGLLPPHLDLSKISSQNNSDLSRLSQSNNNGGNGGNGNGNGNGNNGNGGNGSGGNGNGGGLTIEPLNRHDQQSPPPTSRQNTDTPLSNNGNGPADIRRDSSEPMDLGLDNNNQSGSNNDGQNSDADDGGYSEDEGVHNT